VLLMERRDPALGALLRSWMNGQVLPGFEGRILPVDAPVALRCASLHVPNPGPERDMLIAATALVHGLTVVTRNVADFEVSKVGLLNPWAG
jgi:toxin FitB